VEYTDKNIKVRVAGEEKPHDFAFDGIFGPEIPQVEVFNQVAKPVIDKLMEGYNGTVFAYGQTSSGKTFTMEGPDVIDSDDKKGIIPRMMSYLFETILNSSEHIEFNVKVSFLELYNEKLQDLLDPRKNNLQIKEDKAKGIFVQDATEIYVTSAEQMKQVHKSGFESRTIAATRMNERSSRSHSIFVVAVNQKDTKTDAAKSSKLYFVDLAGSEKISKTQVSGQQLEEAKNINKSLTSLGIVINALTEKEKGHVPYRDSKLTRLLQESLGGNSQTSLILACSMCSYNDKETVGTLRFGYRAKSIKNAPVMNVERSVKELTALLDAAERKLREQDDIIQGLQQQIDNGDVNVNSSFIDMASTIKEKPENILDALEEKSSKMAAALSQPNSQGGNQHQIQSPTPTETKPHHQRMRSKNSLDLNNGATAGSASLTLLKQHIQIVSLNEEIQALKLTNKEQENELSNKNQEVYDLTGRVMQYENQLQELTGRNLAAAEEFQVKFEKMCTENQTNSMQSNKFKRAISRLRSDLNFTFISKNLKMLDTDEKPAKVGGGSQDDKEDLIMNSIQKTIEMLEEIEKDLEEKEEERQPQNSYMNEVEALIESYRINSQGSQKKLLTRRTTMGAKLSDPGSGVTKSNPNEMFTTATDEDFKMITTVATEESTEGKEAAFNMDNLKTEGDVEEDLVQKFQLQSLNDEDKIAEMQNLLSVQRKTINSLNKMNNELTQANQKHNSTQDKKIISYKTKIEDLQKWNAEKAKEYERRIQGLKSLLEDKIKELDLSRSKQEQELLNKTKALSDLKFQNERMQKIILGNDLAKRVFDLEAKIKEFALERQKLFEDVFKLRGEIDDKEEALTEKSAQIQILQCNLNTLSSELEIMRHLRPQQAQNSMPKKEKRDALGNLESGKGSQKNKKDSFFFESHVVKPIRGGGGNVKNFERDNYLIFEKPSLLDATKFAKGESTPKSGDSVEPKSTKATDASSFKKFDEILKAKGTTFKPRNQNSLTVHTTMDDDDDEEEPDYQELQQKLRQYTNQQMHDGQKSVKSFFSGVKNFFS
jgi:kinesin family protein 5